MDRHVDITGYRAHASGFYTRVINSNCINMKKDHAHFKTFNVPIKYVNEHLISMQMTKQSRNRYIQ